jgi:hypothetical protein
MLSSSGTILMHEESSDDSTGVVGGREDNNAYSGSGIISAHEAENEGVGGGDNEVGVIKVVDSGLSSIAARVLVCVENLRGRGEREKEGVLHAKFRKE